MPLSFVPLLFSLVLPEFLTPQNWQGRAVVQVQAGRRPSQRQRNYGGESPSQYANYQIRMRQGIAVRALETTSPLEIIHKPLDPAKPENWVKS